MRKFPTLLFSFFLAMTPSLTLAQNYGEGIEDRKMMEGKLEQRISREDLNEIIRRVNFSKNDVPIIRIQVIDKYSKMPLRGALVELKEENKSIREDYFIGSSSNVFYYPYNTMTDKNGMSVFSVATDNERKISKIEVKCSDYNFYEANFPLFVLLNHINNPLSKPLPDSIEKNLGFEYNWNEAAVFRTDYRDSEEFIDKVSNLDILQYFHNIFGESFYSSYMNHILGRDVPQLLPYLNQEYHILIPVQIEMEKIPQRHEVEIRQ